MKTRFIKRKKISTAWNEARCLVGQVSKKMAQIFIAAAYDRISQNILSNIRHQRKLDYGHAIKAIAESNMNSHDKEKSMTLVKNGECAAYYKAVVAIAGDCTMCSFDKRKAIANIANGGGES